MKGSAFALARWFQPERYANKPEDDFLREELLNELYDADVVAKAPDGSMLVRTPNGAAMVEKDVPADFLVNFDVVSHTNWTRTSFWMNTSSVEDLLARLDDLPEVEFDALFVGATRRDFDRAVAKLARDVKRLGVEFGLNPAVVLDLVKSEAEKEEK